MSLECGPMPKKMASYSSLKRVRKVLCPFPPVRPTIVFRRISTPRVSTTDKLLASTSRGNRSGGVCHRPPPMRSLASKMTTPQPLRARSYATVNPLIPAPIIATVFDLRGSNLMASASWLPNSTQARSSAAISMAPPMSFRKHTPWQGWPQMWLIMPGNGTAFRYNL